MNDSRRYDTRGGFLRRKFCLLWIGMALAIAVLHGHAADAKQPLQMIEIAGVSINTPTEKTAGILQAQGYAQVNESLYTKQEKMQNGRSAMFRMEIEDNATFRQITYSRSLGGGRLKSPTSRDTPVPDSDIDMAQQLYQSVCTNIPEAVQKDRACNPYTPANISFGNGQLIQVDERFAAALDATDASTAISIKFTK